MILQNCWDGDELENIRCCPGLVQVDMLENRFKSTLLVKFAQNMFPIENFSEINSIFWLPIQLYCGCNLISTFGGFSEKVVKINTRNVLFAELRANVFNLQRWRTLSIVKLSSQRLLHLKTNLS